VTAIATPTEIAREYFLRLDAGDATLLELFTEDAQFYFPKFGVGRGHAAIGQALQGLGRALAGVRHHPDSLLFTGSGDRLAVEGKTSGTLKDGRTWAAGVTPAGRFCNVFEFKDGKIARLHIYLDPDYGGDDKGRFLWGDQQAW
jgi:ketosteroid isomerase-like protein